MMIGTRQQDSVGFALLLTLVVISVVLAIGLTLLDITLKQLTLSGTGRDSEIAFHAAYAGAECAQYWREVNNNDYNTGGHPVLGQCLGQTNISPVEQNDYNTDVHYTRYRLSWGTTNDRCVEIDIWVFNAEGLSSGSLDWNVPNYGGAGDESCPAGATCTILFSRGFNRSCDHTDTLRTVQREVVLEY